ncbi:hypothetical protein KCU66_g4, partial [Aureobasidium melanogenum]
MGVGLQMIERSSPEKAKSSKEVDDVLKTVKDGSPERGCELRKQLTRKCWCGTRRWKLEMEVDVEVVEHDDM